MDEIRVAEGLAMDASEASTQTFGAIGAKGSGKSYAAGVIVEELFEAGCPVLVLDPVGNWGKGLRLAADGKSPGLPIAVIGGADGDIDLDPEKGREIGEFLRKREASAVVDISELSKKARKRFVADLAEAVFVASRKLKSPCMFVVEEAHLFAPQRQVPGEERMYGALTDIVRLGRNYGLGCLLITQRPQSVSKEVLNQIECLFVGSMRGSHERKAIREWVSEQGIDDRVSAMLGDLPKLKAGTFYVWSPSWLERFEKVKVRQKRTYDASSTPTLGKKKLAAAALAPIDLGELSQLLTAVKEVDPVKKAGSPSEASGLRASQLTEQVRKLTEENASLRERYRRDVAGIGERIEAVSEALGNLLRHPALGYFSKGFEPLSAEDRHAEALGNLAEAVDQRLSQIVEGPQALQAAIERWDETPPRRAPRSTTAAEGGASASSVYQMELLGAIVQHGPVTRLQLSVITGKSLSSSTFAAGLRQLVSDGLITDERGAGLAATAAGKKRSGAPPLPTGRALHAFWMAKLSAYDGRMLEAMARGPIQGFTRAALSKVTGHSLSSSTFAGGIRTLITLGLCEERARMIRLRDDTRRLFGLGG